VGQRFTGSTDLFDGIQTFLDEIQVYELEHVFHHGIERDRWVLDNDRDRSHE
jgi:hypothetical protein